MRFHVTLLLIVVILGISNVTGHKKKNVKNMKQMKNGGLIWKEVVHYQNLDVGNVLATIMSMFLPAVYQGNPYAQQFGNVMPLNNPGESGSLPLMRNMPQTNFPGPGVSPHGFPSGQPMMPTYPKRFPGTRGFPNISPYMENQWPTMPDNMRIQNSPAQQPMSVSQPILPMGNSQGGLPSTFPNFQSTIPWMGPNFPTQGINNKMISKRKMLESVNPGPYNMEPNNQGILPMAQMPGNGVLPNFGVPMQENFPNEEVLPQRPLFGPNYNPMIPPSQILSPTNYPMDVFPPHFNNLQISGPQQPGLQFLPSGKNKAKKGKRYRK